MGNYRLPSHRRRLLEENPTINLVPMVDSIFNVIFFLLMTTTFISIFEIRSPIPFVATADLKEDKDKLNLVLEINSAELILKDGVSDSILKRFPRDLSNPMLALDSLHQHLLEIKQTKPDENTIIINPDNVVDYNFIIKTMDAVKEILKTDEPIYIKDPQGVSTKAAFLFDNIIFGNLTE